MSGFRMKQAILFVNAKKENAQTLAGEIISELDGCNIQSEIFTREKTELNEKNIYDIAFSLGGDGTVLFAARTMAPYGTPVFPVNLGTLGFIAAIHPDQWSRVFNSWLNGDICLSKRLMLEARVARDNKIIFKSNCLNDIVITASGIAKIIRLKVSSGNDESAGFMSLGQYRSDGLILATPTGSTAYSVAAGGPIVDPEMDAMILNPICPFTLSNRPMVLPASQTVMIEVEEEQRSEVHLTIDGQVMEPLYPGDIVHVSRSPWPAVLIASDRSVFYHALRTKLSWLEAPAGTGRR